MENFVTAGIWLGIFLVLLFVEAQTAALTTIWFLPGAIVAFILAMFNVELWIQITVFFALGIVLLILTKTIFKKYLKVKVKKQPTNADSLIGKTVVVSEHIDNIHALGSVKINGQVWTARMTDDNETAEPGELLTVIEIQGCKLICEHKQGA